MPFITQKLNENTDEVKLSDQFESPKYVLPELLKYIPQHWRIWESACGSGRLVNYLNEFNYKVRYQTDLLMGNDFNYFNIVNYDNVNNLPINTVGVGNNEYDCEITNIPFSIQYKWLTKAISRGKPFAFIVPYKSMEDKMGKLTRKYNLQMLKPDQRFVFYTPHEGWYRCERIILPDSDSEYKCGYKQKEFFDKCPKCGGSGDVTIIKSAPQISTMWITWQLNLPERLVLYDNEKNMMLYPR